MTIEKNWASLVVGDYLYFVCLFEPLRVLRCDPTSAECVDVGTSTSKARFVWNRNVVRGGTQFVPCAPPQLDLYCAWIHSTLATQPLLGTSRRRCVCTECLIQLSLTRVPPITRHRSSCCSQKPLSSPPVLCCLACSPPAALRACVRGRTPPLQRQLGPADGC